MPLQRLQAGALDFAFILAGGATAKAYVLPLVNRSCITLIHAPRRYAIAVLTKSMRSDSVRQKNAGEP